LLTLLISITSGVLLGFLIYLAVGSYLLSILVIISVIIGVNFFIGRNIQKRLLEMQKELQKENRPDRIDAMIEKLKEGYRFSKWQFFVKKSIDSEIGGLLYTVKRFDEAYIYLKEAFIRSWLSRCMLSAHYFRKKDMNNCLKEMEATYKANKGEPFVYSLYAWFLVEVKNQDKAIAVLTKATAKFPLDERIQAELEAVRNNKKLKIQAYTTYWPRLHLGKAQDGVRPYQTLQKFKRK
jgi:tetratricopeptide (TPR) repeat protein